MTHDCKKEKKTLAAAVENELILIDYASIFFYYQLDKLRQFCDKDWKSLYERKMFFLIFLSVFFVNVKVSYNFFSNVI